MDSPHNFPGALFRKTSIQSILCVVFFQVSALFLSGEQISSTFIAEASLPTRGDIEGGLAAHGTQYFFGSMEESTAGMWVTDGSTLGSLPWTCQAVSGPKITAGSWLYYWVDDSELWATDGKSPANARLIQEDFGSPPDWDERRLGSLGDRLFWLVLKKNIWQLWAADATSSWTEMVLESPRGSAPGFLGMMLSAHDRLYFYAPDPDSRTTALWMSDGTAGGTRPVATSVLSTIAPVAARNAVLPVCKIEGNNVLCHVDLAGKFTVIPSAEPEDYLRVLSVWSDGQRVYFEASDRAHGIEIWKLQNEDLSAIRLPDINPGEKNSNPEFLGTFNGHLLVMATTGKKTLLQRISLIDGSSEVIEGLPNDLANHHFIEMVSTSSAAYLVSEGSGQNPPPWLSRMDSAGEIETFGDSWLAGTEAHDSGWPYLSPRRDGQEGILFVSARVAFGSEVWRLDAESEDPVLVKDANSEPVQGAGNLLINPLLATTALEYFTVTAEDEHEYRRIRQDGTTLLLRSGDAEDIGWHLTHNPTTGFSFFVDRQGLWSLLPGATAPGNISRNPTVRPSLAVANIRFTTTPSGILYIATDNLVGVGHIYHSNGAPGVEPDILVERLVYKDRPINFGGLSYYVYFNPALRVQPWYTNGTNVLERWVPFISEVTIAGSTRSMLLISGDSPGDGQGEKLWVYRGGITITAVGAPAVSPFKVPPAEAEDLFYYVGVDGSGEELWVTDGAIDGTHRLTNLQKGNQTGAIRDLTAFDDHLFFAANDEAHGWELWTSDGTEEGTRRISDLQEGEEDSLAESGFQTMGSLGEYLYFAADDGIHGMELWRVHKSGAHPELVEDLMPGPASSNPQNFQTLHGRLFFQANDPAHALMGLREIRSIPNFTPEIDVTTTANEIVLSFGSDTTQAYLLLESDDLQSWRAVASYPKEEAGNPQKWRVPKSEGTAEGTYHRLQPN